MTEPSVSLAADTSGMPEFRNEGANWKANRLYYFGVDTGISYQRDARHPNMFRVAYPDGPLSADCYNLVRVRQHCLDVAHMLYPRRSSCGVTTATTSMAGGAGSRPLIDLGVGEQLTPPDTKPSPATTADAHAIQTKNLGLQAFLHRLGLRLYDDGTERYSPSFGTKMKRLLQRAEDRRLADIVFHRQFGHRLTLGVECGDDALLAGVLEPASAD
jgi:hypothetical protein